MLVTDTHQATWKLFSMSFNLPPGNKKQLHLNTMTNFVLYYFQHEKRRMLQSPGRI